MTTDIKMPRIIRQIGRNLKQARLEKNLDLQTAALGMGLSTRVVSNMEEGVYRDIRMRLLLRFMYYYDLSSSTLFTGIQTNKHLIPATPST